MFENKGFMFWPVGCGDSTTITIDPQTIMQVDLHHLAACDEDGDDHAPIVDELVAHLPKKNNKPYLAAFVMTHPDKDHILGFADLLKKVTIGELWFTPRVFRDYEDECVLCEDAEAFRQEAMRRVKSMIAAGGAAKAGDRVRLIGFDDLLLKEGFVGFPKQFHTIPGNAITVVDGVDRAGDFRAFIHAPFFEDAIADDRNETSVAMQIVLSDRPADGGVLLFGDLSYPTIRRIFDETKKANRMENLAWQVLLAPHHCSKSVMYQHEDDVLKLKQDILDDFEAAQVGDGYIVASSESIPDTNAKGDNPPHAKAKKRYEEIAAGGFVCTHEEGDARAPIEFDVDENGAIAYLGAVGSLTSDEVAKAVQQARGGSAPPVDQVGFG